MKIKISHISKFHNLGSAMMGINMVYYLTSLLVKKGIEDIEYYTDSSSQKELELLKKTSEYKKIYMEKTSGETDNKDGFFLIRKLKSFKGIFDQAKKASQEYDCHIVLGGDDLSEYYGKKRVMIEALRLNLESRNMDVFLTGQTIGPFYSYRKILIPYFIRNTYSYSRDDKTYLYAKNELNINNVYNARDLAFLDLPEQDNLEDRDMLLAKFGLEPERYITIVPSGLSGLYTENTEKYIDNYLSVIINLLDERLEDKKIVLLTHVTEPDVNNDRRMVKAIVERLKDEYLDRIVTIDKELLPHQARWILGSGMFSLSGRMHAAVSTYQMGKPAICLSYSVKYEGVIGQGLNMKNLVIESANDELWEQNEIADKVLIKVDYILRNYSTILNEIEKSVKDCKEKALYMVKDVADKIVSSKGR
ncbi:MAG: polysaccharide pyruvyl transferase family protein [bacterium]